MKLKCPTIHLPLLAKELTEQAARRRTYMIRVIYAIALFVIFGFIFHAMMQELILQRAKSFMGMGGRLFEMIMYLQFAGVFLFLPGLMSTAIVAEKERDSLAFLFLTDLGPWEIILEKYLGRLVPMFAILLLSVPPMAIAYSLGGVSPQEIGNGFAMLALMCLQLGALSLMFSAFFRSSVAAFLAAYIGGAAFYAFLPFIGFMGGANLLFSQKYMEFYFTLWSPALFDLYGSKPFANLMSHSVSIMVSTIIFLFLAKHFLVHRAFLPARNPLLMIFRKLDAFWEHWNHLAGGIVLIKEKYTLPSFEPVFWRETCKRSLGKPQYLIRLLILAELPILFLWVGSSVSEVENGATIVIFTLWCLAALVLSAVSANAIPAERAAQTLDVLLTTSMPGRVIITEKMRASYRLILVFAVPFFSAFLLKGITVWDRDWTAGYLYGVSSLLSFAIYLPLIAWAGCWIGLKCHSRSKATIIALIAIIAWCIAPLLLGWSMGQFGMASGIYSDLALSLSPALMIGAVELALGSISPGDFVSFMAVNFVTSTFVLLLFRHLCLARAERYLGRADAGGTEGKEVLNSNF